MQLSNIANSSGLNVTRFLRCGGDCHCWNVSWRLFLSEKMTATLPMQIKLVFTDLPWVCIFIQLWSSNTAWVPDRSPNRKGLNVPQLGTGHSPNRTPLARILFLFSFTMNSYVQFTLFPSPLGEALGMNVQKIQQWILCWNSVVKCWL